MTSRRIVPLQTHGVYEKIWVPPKEKFVTYEPSDEPWLRYFGIGREENRLAELYDIRTDLKGKPVLVGYARTSPENYYDPQTGLPRFTLTDTIYSPEVRQIAIPLPSFTKEIYACWYVPPSIVNEFCKSKWVLHTDWPDLFDNFVEERQLASEIRLRTEDPAAILYSRFFF